MSKTIKLHSKSEYDQKIKEIQEYLKQVEMQIMQKTLELATLDKFEDWLQETEEGAIMEIDSNNFRNTGDDKLDLLADFLSSLVHIKQQLKS